VTGFGAFLVHLFFGLLAVVGLGVVAVALVVERSVGLALLGGFVTLAGLAGYTWLGD
jgi:hypothetical protein